MTAPTVDTSCGVLRGTREDGLLVFRGIPFAAPPIGQLRWLAPQPVEPWTGERDASEFGSASVQSPIENDMMKLIGIPGGETDEDCLYLNVWTPGLDDAARPVMAWIHGGGNTMGSGSQPRINGEHLAGRGDVVVVTLNYRLGALGFLHAPELDATGNEALLDQVAALRWVRSEIRSFGGDPDNVTLFGQSAGGWDITELLAMRDAAGLVRRAVPMSGSWSRQRTAEEARATSREFAGRFGGFDRLRSVPAEEILAAQLEMAGSGFRFGPVRDGAVVDSDSAASIGAGRFDQEIDLLIGNTLNESALFGVMDPALASVGRDGLIERAGGFFGERAAEAVDAYVEARAARGESTDPWDVWVAIATDQMFRIPAVRVAERHAAHTPRTWMYLFDYPSPALEGRLGSCHSLDIPFVWGTTDAENMARFCGSGPEVDALTETMMGVYLSFARTGDPGTERLPDWPCYETSKRATMRLGLDCRLEEGPMDPEREVWEQLSPLTL